MSGDQIAGCGAVELERDNVDPLVREAPALGFIVKREHERAQARQPHGVGGFVVIEIPMR